MRNRSCDVAWLLSGMRMLHGMRSSRGVRSVTRKAPKVRTEVERGCGLYDEAAVIELRRALAVAVELSVRLVWPSTAKSARCEVEV